MNHIKIITILLIAIVLSAAIYNSPEVNIKFEPLEVHTVNPSNNVCSKQGK